MIKFSLYILLNQNWWQDQCQYLSYTKIIFSSRNISVITFYLLWTLGRTSYIFHHLNFQFWFCLCCYCKVKSISRKYRHKNCTNYARIRIFTDLYSPVQRQDQRFTGQWKPVCWHILCSEKYLQYHLVDRYLLEQCYQLHKK